MTRSVNKVLVTVHGIGDQTRFETLRLVINACYGYRGSPQSVSLGDLHGQVMQATGSTSPQNYIANPHRGWAAGFEHLQDLGFAEVYWADIGRKNETYTQESTTQWVHTLVERLRDRQMALTQGQDAMNLGLVKRVLTDMGVTLRLLGLLNRLGTYVGLGSVELDRILHGYVGDVQLFSEFATIRQEIMERFHATMEAIETQAALENTAVEIHLCAHSQGSVIAFLGLLEGYVYGRPWVQRVRTFFTIGSPIDKFLFLWPRIWQEVCSRAPQSPCEARIQWLNCADVADPVGYKLDIARAFVARTVPGLFADGAPMDQIFGRYPIPGKAHVDYWTDPDVFAYWFSKAQMSRAPQPEAPAPTNKWGARVCSGILPLVAAGGSVLGGAHFVASALSQALNTGTTSMPLGLWHTVAIAALMLGTTVFAASFRATRQWRIFYVGLLVFLIAAWVFLHCIPTCMPASTLCSLAPWTQGHPRAKIVVVALGVVAALLSLLDRFLPYRNGRWLRAPYLWICGVGGLCGFLGMTIGLDVAAASGLLLPYGFGLLLWVLAFYLWDLALVWTHYVRHEGHMVFLKARWGIAKLLP